MKKILLPFAFCLLPIIANAAPADNARAMRAAQMSPGRAVMAPSIARPADDTPTPIAAAADEPVSREVEKQACISNNIGVGNTFVWASRNSNTASYATMIEDVDNPDNNVCWVRVELKSDDSKINVADVAAVYHPMGTDITCGSWADRGMLEKRILDAKKTTRTWGTVAGVVGGAGIGVGAMELFGNKLIGGAVMGQKGIDDAELMRSQMLVLEKEDKAAYDDMFVQMDALKKACEAKFKDTDSQTVWEITGTPLPDACTRYDYNAVLQIKK